MVVTESMDSRSRDELLIMIVILDSVEKRGAQW